MIDFLFRRKPIVLIYVLFSPWLLLMISPLIKYPTNLIHKAISHVFIIFWLQSAIYFYLTYAFGKKLTLKALPTINCTIGNTILYYSLVEFAICSTMFFLVISNTQGTTDTITIELLKMALLTIELFRAKAFAKLIVSIERNREANFKEYLATLLIATYPVVGIWILHQRLVKLLHQTS